MLNLYRLLISGMHIGVNQWRSKGVTGVEPFPLFKFLGHANFTKHGSFRGRKRISQLWRTRICVAPKTLIAFVASVCAFGRAKCFTADEQSHGSCFRRPMRLAEFSRNRGKFVEPSWQGCSLAFSDGKMCASKALGELLP